MPPDPVLVLDLGTSAVKGALVDTGGGILAQGRCALSTSHPGPGAAEQDPDDWWAATGTVVRACAGARPPVALAVTGQMQDVVPLDDAGRPTGPALLYSDRRAGAQAADLLARHPGWPRATRNTEDASSAPAMLARLRAHDPGRLQRAAWLALGAPGAVLARAAGGGPPACDLTTASTTGLLDRATHGWWAPLLAEFEDLGLREMLPRLVDGASVVGTLAAGPAADLGLPAGLPLVHAPGDAGAVTAGLVGEDPGRASVSIGTTAWVAAISAHPLGPDESLHDLAGPGGRGVLGIGATLSAGASIDHALRTHLPGLDHAAADARAAERGRSGLLHLPSLSGERCPVRDDLARGTIVGLTPTTDGVDLYRATLEGVAMSLRHIGARLDPGLLDDPDGPPLPVSGGGSRAALLLRILADVLRRPVVPLADGHAGLRGAHRAAAHALGLEAPPPLLAGVDPAAVVRPGPDADAYAPLLEAHLGLWRALRPAFGALEAARVTP